MKKNFLLSPGAETAGNGKPDQADVLAELTGMKTALAKINLSLPDLISQHASLTAEKGTLTGELAKLKGDSTKLVAGATMQADLVSASNLVFNLTTERDTLKSEKVSVDEAAAKKIVALGFTDNTKAAAATQAGAKPQTLTEKVLAAKGVKTLAEANEKFQAACAANPGA